MNKSFIITPIKSLMVFTPCMVGVCMVLGLWGVGGTVKYVDINQHKPESKSDSQPYVVYETKECSDLQPPNRPLTKRDWEHSI